MIRRAIVISSENNGSKHKIEYSVAGGSKTFAVVATTSLSIPKEIHVESSAIHEGQKMVEGEAFKYILGPQLHLVEEV